ncbi:MAG: hypothetical protein L6R39_006234 [Caloplaca ligustica]|nr:MAG: hypothetical protein L6R39_006234 [Caloplaca ligustica]
MAIPSQQFQPIVEAIAGFIAGLASTLVAHPLDVLKTRLQVDRASPSQLGTSLRLAQRIIKDEGLAQGFYRGLSPNLIGSSVSWALYFFWYSRIKGAIASHRAPSGRLSYYDFFLASGTAGILSGRYRAFRTRLANGYHTGALTAICTNPIWVIKTRMLSSASGRPGAYRSTTHGTQQIYREEGIRGFYRGLVPSLFGVSHGALQFMAYEQLKRYQAHRVGRAQGDLTAVDYLWLSGTSKVFAGTATYPYQVVRSRLQMYEAGRTYKGVRDAVAQMWKQEGLAGINGSLSDRTAAPVRRGRQADEQSDDLHGHKRSLRCTMFRRLEPELVLVEGIRCAVGPNRRNKGIYDLWSRPI